MTLCMRDVPVFLNSSERINDVEWKGTWKHEFPQSPQ